MSKLLRWWLREWAVLDILVLGGSLLAGRMYFLYWEQHQAHPDAWFDIWPNLTTEVMGAWLSVRIINYMLQRREKRSHARWRQADIANYLKDLARGISRYPDGFEVDRLSDEIDFYHEPHNSSQRNRYLDHSERQDLDNVIVVGKELVADAKLYAGAVAARNRLTYDDPARSTVDIQLATQHEALKVKASLLAEGASRARQNILEEEFRHE